MGQRVFDTVEQAVKELKLDRRRRWHEFAGEVVRAEWYTHPCSGCSHYDEGNFKYSNGCDECGYTGKHRGVYPVPAIDKAGNIVKVKPQ